MEKKKNQIAVAENKKIAKVEDTTIVEQIIIKDKELNKIQIKSSEDYAVNLANSDAQEYAIISKMLDVAETQEERQGILDYMERQRKERIKASQEHDAFLLEYTKEEHNYNIKYSAVVVGVFFVLGMVYGQHQSIIH